MVSYLIAIDFPTSTKRQLASFCYGLPAVHWIEEENFYLILRYIGPVNDQILVDIKESLAHVSFLPFSIQLQGVEHSYSKRGEKILWVGISPHPSLINLKKEVDKALKNLKIAPNEHPFKPYIAIGRYEHLNPDRLGEYLSLHSLYRSESIEVSCFTLFCIQVTPKRTIYQEIKQYPSNSLFSLD